VERPDTLRLADLIAGAPGVVFGFDGDAAADGVLERLRELGFDEGVDVELMHRGPFGGDPLAVRVGASLIAMRISEAKRVLVSAGRAA
jgi:ferrous iron transport protein A